jgi:limonene-1,2-epoxide hydrolase
MDLRPGVGVVVGRGGVKPVELNSVHPDLARGIEPSRPRQQRRGIPRGEKPTAQCNGRKSMPGIRPGNHGDPHWLTLPQRSTATLAAMTDQVSQVGSDVDNARTVETLLYAVQDEDFDTVDSVLADNIVWQNVGLPSIRGRDRIVKLLRRGEGRFGFEVKIHRIAAEGNSVLTERTDALIIWPLRLQFW